MRKRRLLAWLLIGLCMASYRASAEPEQKIYHLFGTTMGNKYAISWAADPTSAKQVHELRLKVEHRLEQLNASMSTWREDSEINAINNAPANQPIRLSDELLWVVSEAHRIGLMTDGALDITIGPLIDLWGFGPKGLPGRLPTPQEVARVKAHTGPETFTLAAGQLSKTSDHTRLDLSSIAKGYGVDALGQLLESNGIHHYLVEIGGEIVARGQRPDGRPWTVAVVNPAPTRLAATTLIPLTDMAVATSGDYHHYFESQGTRFSHVIDPQSGRAVQTQIVSATVIAPQCATADGLATAAMVMGVEDMLRLAESQQLAVMLIEDHFGQVRVHRSRAFEQLLRP
ncbi:FAD:protein FMN transferase [Ferrimonas balearica]|uniref:FAD:protein FMN transferase n=1 Tax=Ferrimonas balearica TaxID=44012 RepID=UPI001C951759|nr:FAD:protein FMN transferase [Ferrimonas balearica]MBY5978675.1 FAD:protein FMN transferase [Ferrimonas balearica]